MYRTVYVTPRSGHDNSDTVWRERHGLGKTITTIHTGIRLTRRLTGEGGGVRRRRGDTSSSIARRPGRARFARWTRFPSPSNNTAYWAHIVRRNIISVTGGRQNITFDNRNGYRGWRCGVGLSRHRRIIPLYIQLLFNIIYFTSPTSLSIPSVCRISNIMHVNHRRRWKKKIRISLHVYVYDERTPPRCSETPPSLRFSKYAWTCAWYADGLGNDEEIVSSPRNRHAFLHSWFDIFFNSWKK